MPSPSVTAKACARTRYADPILAEHLDTLPPIVTRCIAGLPGGASYSYARGVLTVQYGADQSHLRVTLALYMPADT